MKLVIEIQEGKLSYFMDLIKNLSFVRLVETKKNSVDTLKIKRKNGLSSENDKVLSPLDYNKYKFDSKDLKFDRNEINERG
jgi:hypothetical protein